MGSTFHAICVGVATALVLLSFSFGYFHKTDISKCRDHTQYPHTQKKVEDGRTKDALLKRNELSSMLNQLKQEYGKLSCQMLQLQSKHGEQVVTKVSQFGGWCREASQSNKGSHLFDTKMAGALSHFFRGKRVASFGDGPGDYKRYIDKSGKVLVYDAFDGAPYSPENSNGSVKFLDLTAPQYGLPAYDWIVSLEVAEHIPSRFEKIYIDNIVRHAKEGIVLSWAVPGQGGLAHVNNRPLDYVIRTLHEKGFDHDKNWSTALQRKATFPWLKSNVNVYYRNQATRLNEETL